jgi:hypothetical protein
MQEEQRNTAAARIYYCGLMVAKRYDRFAAPGPARLVALQPAGSPARGIHRARRPDICAGELDSIADLLHAGALVKRGLQIDVELVAGVADRDQRRQDQHCPFAIVEHRPAHYAADAILQHVAGESRIGLGELVQRPTQDRGKVLGLVPGEPHEGRVVHGLTPCRVQEREQGAGTVGRRFRDHVPRLHMKVHDRLRPETRTGGEPPEKCLRLACPQRLSRDRQP